MRTQSNILEKESRVRRTSTVEHVVKSWPQFFGPMLNGTKTHDLRKATDRNYQVGDRLRLQEYDPLRERYTGRELVLQITYITSADAPCALSEQGLHPDYCILSVSRL